MLVQERLGMMRLIRFIMNELTWIQLAVLYALDEYERGTDDR